jgi:hypothetical protein
MAKRERKTARHGNNHNNKVRMIRHQWKNGRDSEGSTPAGLATPSSTSTNAVRTGNVPRFRGGDLSETFEDLSVSFVIAVAEIESCHIHPGIHEFAQILLTPRGRPDRAHDLGTSVQGVDRCRHHVEGDETTRQQGDVGGVGNGHDETTTI